MKILRTFSRIIVGLVFIFSGFVKGVDPLGSTYKFQDYFAAFDLTFLDPLAFFLAVLLIAFEFVIGFALVFNVRMKMVSWVLLVFMSLFTLLTLYLAIENPVHDCGCFGDAIIMTNWETFYKNIVLMAMTLIIFFNRKKFRSPLSLFWQNIVMAIGGVLIIGISVYSYRHLPPLDFRPWSIGSNMKPFDESRQIIYLKFRNKETGEIKEYPSDNYPWNDSVWTSKWEFVEQRVEQGDIQLKHNLVVEDRQGNDRTENFIYNSDYQFLFVAYDLDKTHRKSFRKIVPFYHQADETGYSFIVLTNETWGRIEKFRESMNLPASLEFYQADDIEMKTMIRSNPGLMLLKNGVVKDKWHYNDLPLFNEVKEQYMEN